MPPRPPAGGPVAYAVGNQRLAWPPHSLPPSGSTARWALTLPLEPTSKTLAINVLRLASRASLRYDARGTGYLDCPKRRLFRQAVGKRDAYHSVAQRLTKAMLGDFPALHVNWAAAAPLAQAAAAERVEQFTYPVATFMAFLGCNLACKAAIWPALPAFWPVKSGNVPRGTVVWLLSCSFVPCCSRLENTTCV